jgi:hypothetical protein
MSKTDQEERDLENEQAAKESEPEIERDFRAIGLIPRLIQECQELQGSVFTFDEITKALYGYRKGV